MNAKKTTLGYPIIYPAPPIQQETAIVVYDPRSVARAEEPPPRIDAQPAAKRPKLAPRSSNPRVLPLLGGLVLASAATLGLVHIARAPARASIATTASTTTNASAAPVVRAIVSPTPIAAPVIPLPAQHADAIGSCQLQIDSRPSGGEVWVGDKPVGAAPVSLQGLRCGWPQRVVVRQAQFEPWSRTITTREGEPTAVVASLRRPTTWLTIESTPPGAEVRLNGKEIGNTPMRATVKAWKAATIELRKTGYAPVHQTAEPDLDGKATIRASLQPLAT